MSAPTSYSVEQAAAAIVGTDETGTLPPGAVQWVTRRLRRGDFGGFKAQRHWRMTDADIAAAIESLRPKPRPVQVFAPPAIAAASDRPLLSSMTRTSRRRMAVSK